MKIGPQEHRTTAISASNSATIVVRGHDLAAELIGNVNFTDYFWLLVTGKAATPAQRRVLDATLVAIAEHGLVPSVQASRMTLAAAPESLQGAVAAGLLGCGTVVLGSSEAAGVFLADIARRAEVASGASQETSWQGPATAVVQEYRAARRPIPGYGHPLHKDLDPRARRLFAIAQEEGISGRHVAIALEVQRLLPTLVGKELAVNVSGAIPAVLLDAGFPLSALKGVPLLARTAGLIAHLVEEIQRPIGFVLSHAAASAIEYDGVSPEGFEPTHE